MKKGKKYNKEHFFNLVDFINQKRYTITVVRETKTKCSLTIK